MIHFLLVQISDPTHITIIHAMSATTIPLSIVHPYCCTLMISAPIISPLVTTKLINKARYDLLSHELFFSSGSKKNHVRSQNPTYQATM